jgi:nucleotide-binding universal stress UspA family protein
MYRQIMTPVDLANLDALERALTTAADLARHYKAPVTYVGVTAATPSAIAHNPNEYAAKLSAFAKAQGEKHGHDAAAHPVISHDPASDLEDSLMKAVDETGADLVVMASHIPNLADHLWPSHGGALARHAKASVFVVRDPAA